VDFKFLLNGKMVTTSAAPEKKLVDVLKENFEIESLRRGCRGGICGICTVLLDENPVPSCLVPIFKLSASDIMTEEGLTERKIYRDLQNAFQDAGYTPCDYCRPSTMVIACSILERNPEAGENEIVDAFAGRNCSCTDLHSIVKVVRTAGRMIKGQIYG
jgi:aerobic-type carbon monoxide dehydrogenase small subunit (CoxS/CutS family)